MSEPTPLNAEELAAVRGWKPLTAVRWWLSMSSYRKGKHSRYLATIDAQATEIAALADALITAQIAYHNLGEHRGLPERCDLYLCRRWNEMTAARVLAGKEAQCPKCEGRGFIRTMVDGERDSEPCSFCRMSGLAGKGAQGD